MAPRVHAYMGSRPAVLLGGNTGRTRARPASRVLLADPFKPCQQQPLVGRMAPESALQLFPNDSHELPCLCFPPPQHAAEELNQAPILDDDVVQFGISPDVVPGRSDLHA